MKLSDWLLVLPDWGLGQVANFIGSWGKKLRHINKTSPTAIAVRDLHWWRVRLPGGGAEKGAKQGADLSGFRIREQSSATCCQDMLRNSRVD